MRCLDLFSGIGGFALACEWAGIETAAFCEIEPFCQSVLRKHWPDVPIHGDIRTLGKSDVGPVDLVCGGFPCQPYSHAGKRKGKEDDRDLWPEMLRVVREFRPAWVCGENVAGFIGLGLDSCLSDLEDSGYQARTFVLPAMGVGAAFIGYRLFIVATTRREPWADIRGVAGGQGNPTKSIEWAEEGDRKEDRFVPEMVAYHGRSCEPFIRGRNHGLPEELDRLRALGNAVVPQQVYPILAAIRRCSGTH